MHHKSNSYSDTEVTDFFFSLQWEPSPMSLSFLPTIKRINQRLSLGEVMTPRVMCCIAIRNNESMTAGAGFHFDFSDNAA